MHFNLDYTGVVDNLFYLLYESQNFIDLILSNSFKLYNWSTLLKLTGNGDKYMLPIVDYGGIALVVSKITAVGGVGSDNNNYGFDVYLSGKEDPVYIAFSDEKQADNARKELMAIIAQYYYIQEFGPDFDLNDLAEYDNEDDSDEDKDKH